MKQTLLLFATALLLGIHSYSQTGVAINTTGADPDGSAMLDVSSTEKGILIPRMSETQRIAIAYPAIGLLVYQNDGNEGFYYYDGTAWTILGGGNQWTTNGSNIYYNAGNVGLGTDSPNALLNIHGTGTGEGNVLFTGEYKSISGNPPAEGVGTRFMWYPDKAALRAGKVDGTQWDNSSIGTISVALGYNTIASGTYSTALGANTKATNFHSTAFGRLTEASGQHSTAMGYLTEAIGNYGTSMGSQTKATGVTSTAMGEFTTASAHFSTAMGRYTTAQAYMSVVIGRYNVLSGSSTSWEALDPLFVIGNGSTDLNRSNAFTMLKNANTTIGGSLTINGNGTDVSITFPDGRGSSGQVLSSDGSGGINWVTPTSGTGSQWTTNGSNIYYNAGNVGIGTNNPGSPLQFSNAVANRKITLFTNTTNDHQFYGFGINDYVLRYQVIATNSSHVFFAGESSTNSKELLRIKGTGQLVIPALNQAGVLLNNTAGEISSSIGTIGQVLTTNGSGGISWATPASGTIAGVSGTAPIVSTGGTSPNISITPATTAAAGSMSADDKTKLDSLVSSQWTTSGSNISYSNGFVGIGISDPLKFVHLNISDTPCIRFEQDASSVWAPYIWDVAGNETNFFVRDVTGGSTLPFKIKPGAPTNSIYISSNGFVGIGTPAPTRKLHITDAMHLQPTSEPANAVAGDLYFDSSMNKLRCHDGTAWHNLW